MSLCGRVAVITGGARGLGKAYGEALLQRQARVVLGDVLDGAGQSTAEEFNAKYGADAAIYVYTDVTKQDSVDALYQAALDKYHRVDIVINNAGVNGKDMPWEVTMDINFNGIARSSDTALKHLSRELGGQGGTLVNIGSVAGLYAGPGGFFYTASKHAVVGFTKSLAMKQTESSGVKVHCLCPSFVKTPMTEQLQEADRSRDPMAQKRLDRYGGWTSQEDVVSACMSCIEQDLVQGAVVMVTGHGAHYVDTELKKTPFP